MRIVVLCALVATTLFTANSAEARHRRRCCNNGYSYYGQTAWTGQSGWNHYAPTAPCQGGACGVAAPVQAACAPAQPATYTSAYPPSADPNAAVVSPPVQQQVIQPNAGTANGQLQSPPPPQPINN